MRSRPSKSWMRGSGGGRTRRLRRCHHTTHLSSSSSSRPATLSSSGRGSQAVVTTSSSNSSKSPPQQHRARCCPGRSRASSTGCRCAGVQMVGCPALAWCMLAEEAALTQTQLCILPST